MNMTTPNKLYPLFLTRKLAETKRFYTEVAGFALTVETPTYLQPASNEPDGPELAFMAPDALPDGVVRPVFAGDGVVVSIPTPDADAKHDELIAAGARPDTPPTDKPWGWRSFLVTDPNGVMLDFFHVKTVIA